MRFLFSHRPLFVSSFLILFYFLTLGAGNIPGWADDTKKSTDKIPSKTPRLIYESNFDNRNSEHWSHRKFVQWQNRTLPWLGEFHQEKVTFSISKLPQHKFVKVELDLALLRSWGGHLGGHPADRPDVMNIALKEGRTLLHATFANTRDAQFKQSFPDCFPLANHPGFLGAKQTNDNNLPSIPGDANGTNSVYSLDFVFPHQDTQLQLVFQASLPELIAANRNYKNESWAVKDVKVTLYNQPPTTLTKERFDQLWKALGRPQGMDGYRAKWELIGTGDETVALIEKKLNVDAGEVEKLKNQFFRLLPGLDDARFQVREKTFERLRLMGLPSLPLIRIALKNKLASPEARKKLESLEASFEQTLEKQVTDGPHLVRLHHVLEVIGTPQANIMRGFLPEHRMDQK